MPEQLAKDLYGAAGSYISQAETQLTSLSGSLSSNTVRLRRYISDINRGRWIIIASGLMLCLWLSLYHWRSHTASSYDGLLARVLALQNTKLGAMLCITVVDV